MIVFKGAGPGTHWHINDARIHGFTCAASRAITSNSVITHITAYSHPSPLISFTTSFAVAKNGYALLGPGGLASNTNPGYVYEVDFQQLPPSHNIVVCNPVQDLSNSSGIGHQHDGSLDLIEGVAKNDHAILSRVVEKVGGKKGIPVVSTSLIAIINAIRDAEVLLVAVPANCVVNRHDVW